MRPAEPTALLDSAVSAQTNGKAERFIRTCLGEWAYVRSYPTSVARASALPAFLRYYHEDRFHMGLNGLTPMQRLATHSVNNVFTKYT